MDEKQLPEIPGIDADDWEQTPLSVRKLMVQLVLKVEQLEQQLKELQVENQQLREKTNRNSHNSHSPPASDPQNRQKREKKKPTGKSEGDNQVIPVIAGSCIQ